MNFNFALWLLDERGGPFVILRIRFASVPEMNGYAWEVELLNELSLFQRRA